MKIAMYAFSGDPITRGHINIIERILKVFDRIYVAIGVNPDKKYLFTLEERKELAANALVQFKNVEVISFEGLLIDCAYEYGVDIIVKGVRNSIDFDYEQMFHQIGETQKVGIDTYLLFADKDLVHVRSSVVKSLQKESGVIDEYVPVHVKEALEKKISYQYIVGISGEIGAGKSYISNLLVCRCIEENIPFKYIELDKIGHEILGTLTALPYVNVRKDLALAFGEEILLDTENYFIDRKKLGKIIFDDSTGFLLKSLNFLMKKPLQVRLRNQLRYAKGLILIEGATLIESQLTHLFNNNMILINVDKKTQAKRLKDRGHNQNQIQRRIHSQYSFNKKRDCIKEIIKQDSHGSIYIINNSDSWQCFLLKNVNNVFNSIRQDSNL